MSFLEFVRGPALAFAVTVFVVGTLWRLIGVLRLPALPDRSPVRAGAPSLLRAAQLMHAVLFAFSRGAAGLRFGHRGVRW